MMGIFYSSFIASNELKKKIHIRSPMFKIFALFSINFIPIDFMIHELKFSVR